MPWPKYHSGANRQVGETQLKLLRRAARAPLGRIIVHPEDSNRDWCAMKRMVQRGLFNKTRFGSDEIGWIYVYEITSAGRDKLRTISR